MTTSLLENEIREQPAVLAARAEEGMAAAREAAAILRGGEVAYLALAARGSSDNAARFAQYLFGHHLGLATFLAAPSLYTAGGREQDMTGSAVLGVSQSGQSPDIVTVLRAARDQGRPTVALTNDPESPLAAEADVVVPLLAGPERSVAATKTYTTTLHAFVQLAVAMGATGLDADLVRLPDLVEQTVAHAFESSPDLVSAVLTSGSGRVDVLPLTAVGRGTGFATASETALKIREVAGVRAESYSVPDLLHGPVAANGPGSTAWVICSPGHPAGYWDDVLARLVSGNVHVVALTTEGRERLVPTSVSLPPDMASWAFDFVAVLLGQVTALRLGEMRSLDVDRPPGLRKVTRTA